MQNLSADGVRHTRGVRDVIGQDDLEDEAPGVGRWTPGGPSGVVGWLAGGALLLVGAAVVLGAGRAEPDAGAGSAAGVRVSADAPSAAGGRSAPEVPPPDVPLGVQLPGVQPRALRRSADPALRASLAVRPLGGRTVETDAGARGDVRLEVRNGGAPLRLRSLSAEVPGVRFSTVGAPYGGRLVQDERAEVVLRFAIDDCAALRRTGRLVLQVEQAGTLHEVGLTVTNDREAGTVRQVALDRVLGACPF